MDALKLSCDPFAEITDWREVGIGRDRFKLMLNLSPFCGEIIRLLVETEGFGCLWRQRPEVIAEAGDLLIHLHKPLLELLACIVLGAREPTEFLGNIRMELVIIPQAEQIGLDEVEDMLLHKVSRHRVAFGTTILMASLVCATGVVASLVALPACPSRASESATTYAADDSTGQ